MRFLAKGLLEINLLLDFDSASLAISLGLLNGILHKRQRNPALFHQDSVWIMDFILELRTKLFELLLSYYARISEPASVRRNTSRLP